MFDVARRPFASSSQGASLVSQGGLTSLQVDLHQAGLGSGHLTALCDGQMQANIANAGRGRGLPLNGDLPRRHRAFAGPLCAGGSPGPPGTAMTRQLRQCAMPPSRRGLADEPASVKALQLEGFGQLMVAVGGHPTITMQAAGPGGAVDRFHAPIGYFIIHFSSHDRVLLIDLWH
jgi:hypothetical protein